MVTRKNKNKSPLARVNQQQNQQPQFNTPDNNENLISAFSVVLRYLFGKLNYYFFFAFSFFFFFFLLF